MYASARGTANGVRRYRSVAEFPLSLLIGFIAGFFGAIPPGPLNVTCLRKGLQGRHREAYRVAAGGSAMDALVCLLIGLGLGWILEKVVTNLWVRAALSIFLVGYGLKLLVVDRRSDRLALASRAAEAGISDERSTPVAAPGPFRLPVLTGLLQGAANPALFVNWTILISFLVGHRLFVPTGASALGFALGVGTGVFVWFTVLIELVNRWKSRAGAWVVRSTTLAGLLLVGFGVFFTWRSFAVK
jgi:threonine/homoserine/homoserine lactone efflux protein